jgi:hypothetical protein
MGGMAARGEDARGRRGGGGLQNDDGRFSAKWSRKRNFVFLVDKYFGTRGV